MMRLANGSTIFILSAICLILGSLYAGAASSVHAVDAPRGPGDFPDEPVRAPDNPAQRFLVGIILFFVSIPVLGLEIYTIADPEQAYLLFRRDLKYRGEVEFTDFYLALTRYGAVFGLLLYSLLLIALGHGLVLILALAAVGLLYISMR